MRAAAAVVVGIVIGAVGAITVQQLLMEGGPMPSPMPSIGPTASPTPTALPSPMCDALVKLSRAAPRSWPSPTTCAWPSTAR